jgi:hypothetical protein
MGQKGQRGTAKTGARGYPACTRCTRRVPCLASPRAVAPLPPPTPRKARFQTHRGQGGRVAPRADDQLHAGGVFGGCTRRVRVRSWIGGAGADPGVPSSHPLRCVRRFILTMVLGSCLLMALDDPGCTEACKQEAVLNKVRGRGRAGRLRGAMQQGTPCTRAEAVHYRSFYPSLMYIDGECTLQPL